MVRVGRLSAFAIVICSGCSTDARSGVMNIYLVYIFIIVCAQSMKNERSNYGCVCVWVRKLVHLQVFNILFYVPQRMKCKCVVVAKFLNSY